MPVELDLVTGLLKACLAARGKRSRNVAQLGAGVIAFMEGAFQLASAAIGTSDKRGRILLKNSGRR